MICSKRFPLRYTVVLVVLHGPSDRTSYLRQAGVPIEAACGDPGSSRYKETFP